MKSYSRNRIAMGELYDSTTFRAEAFNALNMPVDAAPGATLNSKTFGRIGSMASTQRELQLALKIYF